MERIRLNGIWRMTGENGEAYNASVPGTVLKALLENGAIPDPFDGMNEYSVCERTRETWRFERTFILTEEQLSRKHTDLVFEGLDTLCTVSVNGYEAARCDNMHRTWRIPAAGILRPGENRISIVFMPALDYTDRAAEENPDILYSGGSERLWTGSLRKAHYMFGWDWGPCLPDAGIWRDVTIESYNVRLSDVMIRQEHNNGGVKLLIDTVTDAGTAEAVLTDPDGRIACRTEGYGRLCLTVAEPRLWWPNGLGRQDLYSLNVRILSDGHTEDEKNFRIGLRTMTVCRERDEWGEEFAFCCNGQRFFAMGADYIPEDNLITRMNRERTDRLLEDCRDAHFNSIRVWGGGFYPSDDFYDLCDEKGLVVWQDLMFACNTYRMTPSFRENIIREAEDNIRRFRHHASLGLISGNNEMETAWLEWDEVKKQGEDLRNDYLEQFEHVLKDICLREAPDTFYWPSSPSSGGGFDEPNDLNRGDVHDWSVWHGRRPFSDFTHRYPRFCSEFGFESFPCTDTLKTFIHEDRDMNPFSQVMESHQKCRSGNSTMLYYLAQTLRYPFSMDGLVHATQYLQAEAIRAGVEHWRRNRGRCMGAIFWQVNDCWPVASWSSVDSNGRRKALQYAAKRFFAPVLISPVPAGDGYDVYVCNERRNTFTGTVVCREADETGRTAREYRFGTQCPPMTSVRADHFSTGNSGIPGVARFLLLDGDGNTVSENEAISCLPKHFPFREPGIRIESEGTVITVTADTFCMGVCLEAGDTVFSDNWFTLYPGETRTVTADRPVSTDRINARWIR